MAMPFPAAQYTTALHCNLESLWLLPSTLPKTPSVSEFIHAKQPLGTVCHTQLPGAAWPSAPDYYKLHLL